MDQALGDYFESSKYLTKGSYFCIDMKRFISNYNVHLLPLLKYESRVYFFVEDIKDTLKEERTEPEDDETIPEGKFISKCHTRLSQCRSVKHPFPPESILTNNFKQNKIPPTFFSTQIDFILKICKRHTKSLARFGTKSCLTFLMAGDIGCGSE